MFRATKAALVSAGAAALLLAACGSDKSDVPEATTVPTTAAASATTTAATATTTAQTVVLIKVGDACSVYGASQKAGAVLLYCDGEVWGTEVPPSTTAAPAG